MRLIPIIILSIFLTGCGIFEKRAEPPVIAPKVVRIDSEILQLCPLLKEDIVIGTFEDSLIVYGDLAAQYGACAKKQANSVKLLKEFSGVSK